ncbi:MAG: hypothetical protein IJV62_02745, partial [Eggerthellaceae bacterium]|nr:hypothetical protein [Eggerthellaceae bacterium]
KIVVWDFKTGIKDDKAYKESTKGSNYERQLQFYKLLIEESAAYDGCKVVCGKDIFVEPKKHTTDELHEPAEASASEEAMNHIKALIPAVWTLIQHGVFDTTAFETSDHYKQALSKDLTKDGKQRKNKTKKIFQDAYEAWIIDEAAKFME